MVEELAEVERKGGVLADRQHSSVPGLELVGVAVALLVMRRRATFFFAAAASAASVAGSLAREACSSVLALSLERRSSVFVGAIALGARRALHCSHRP